MKLKSWKDKANNLLKKSVTMSKAALGFAIEYAVTMLVILGIAITALKLPEMHNKYLRYTVGNKVYMIRGGPQTGGGTGFAVKAPSGASYILTNDHVCDGFGDSVLVTGDEGSMRRRIIAHDENSDLCLIEGLPGVEGLSIARFGPSRGDIMYVVGHPLLMPKHVSQGEITGSSDVTINMGPISVINPNTKKEEQIPPEVGGILPEQCSMNKHTQQWEDLDLMFFVVKVKWCLLTVKDAYGTSITIHPGNSGSPMVNFWGNVEGVAFASNRTNWGKIVPIQDIKEFLKNY